MNKKADINLSINMIVVLIIGIVILGLALGFIRGMFGNLTKQFEELVKEEPEPDAATSTQHITVSSQTKILDVKKPGVYKMNIYNPTQTNWTDVKPQLKCGTTLFTQSKGGGDVQVFSKSVPSAQSESYTYLFIVPTTLGPGDYLCKVAINYTAGTEFGVENSPYYQEVTMKIQG